MTEAAAAARLLCLLLLAVAPASRAQSEAASGQEPAPAAPRRVVKPGDWIWIDFALWEEDGNLLETTTHSQPLRLRHGDGRVPPQIEQAMLGMAVDEHKSVRLPPRADADPAAADRYETVPLDSIPESTRSIGHPIVKDAGSGTRRAGRVHEIDGDRVVIDWDPVAGQTLTFDFRIVEIHVPESGE